MHPSLPLFFDVGFDTSDADFILKSSDDVEFRVHKLKNFLTSANHLCNAPVAYDLSERKQCHPGHIDLNVLSCCGCRFWRPFGCLWGVGGGHEVWLRRKKSFEVKPAYNAERVPLRVYMTSIALGLKKEAIKASKVFFTFYFWLCEDLRTWNGGSTCDPIIGYWIVEMGWLLSSLWRRTKEDNCLPYDRARMGNQ